MREGACVAVFTKNIDLPQVQQFIELQFQTVAWLWMTDHHFILHRLGKQLVGLAEVFVEIAFGKGRFRFQQAQ